MNGNHWKLGRSEEGFSSEPQGECGPVARGSGTLASELRESEFLLLHPQFVTLIYLLYHYSFNFSPSDKLIFKQLAHILL